MMKINTEFGQDQALITPVKIWNCLKIEEYFGTWSKIGEGIYQKDKKIYLLESDQYGDGANFLLVDENLVVLSDEVFDFHCLQCPDDYINEF